MKKIIIILLLSMICTEQEVSSSMIEKISEERGYISSSSEKTKDVYPNIAEVTFTKETTAKTIEAASIENKEVINEIKKELEKYKKEKADTTEISTGAYTANPNYIYKSNKKQLTGYTVTNSITVRTKSTEMLGKMIDSAIKAGADRVNALSFSYENDGTICKDLIYEAAREAENIAQVAANSAKHTIKGVKAIHTGCYTQMNNRTNVRNNYSAKMMSFGANNGAEDAVAEPATSITPGKIKVRATVNAEYYVK